MSGYAAETMSRYGLDAAHTRLVQKPFSAKVLAQAVRDALDAQVTPRDSARGSQAP